MQAQLHGAPAYMLCYVRSMSLDWFKLVICAVPRCTDEQTADAASRAAVVVDASAQLLAMERASANDVAVHGDVVHCVFC